MNELLKTAGGALAIVAPTLATAIGGPLAGTAVTFLIKALGLAADATPAQIGAAVQGATPEQLAAIQQAEGDFKEAMAKLGVQREQLAYEDTKDARGMQAAAISARSPLQYAQLVISLVILGLFGAAMLGFTPGLDAAKEELLKASVVLVLGFWLGSSARSTTADAQLLNSVPASLVQGGTSIRGANSR